VDEGGKGPHPSGETRGHVTNKVIHHHAYIKNKSFTNARMFFSFLNWNSAKKKGGLLSKGKQKLYKCNDDIAMLVSTSFLNDDSPLYLSA
jgi:hypothetical protein